MTPSTVQQGFEDEIHMICVDAWASINDSLQKDGVKYKGDGIGTAYGGWTALCSVVEPRVKALFLTLANERIESLKGEIIPTEMRFGDKIVKQPLNSREEAHNLAKQQELTYYEGLIKDLNKLQ